MKIGILGLGFVGSAMEKYFASKKIKTNKYDKYKKIGSIEEVNRSEVVFICVPTPYKPENGFDLSMVEEAISYLSPGKIVVIKSTVLPGSTEKLQKKFPRHKLLFNPEFLREVSAAYDMANPDRQIVGYNKQSKGVAKKVLKILPKSPYMAIMPSKEAEVVKYMANSFLALKVVFANEFYNICQKLGADYKKVKEAVVKDPRIGDSHFDIHHGNYRGYGGSCFPKDVNAIIQLANSKKIKTELLKVMREINRKYLKQSGLKEDHFLNNHHKKER